MSHMKTKVPVLPMPPKGWIPGTGYFALKTNKAELKAWHATVREWKIKHDGWH